MTDSTWVVRAEGGDRERAVDSRAEAEEVQEEMEDLGLEVEIIPPGSAGDESNAMLVDCAECGEPVDVREAEDDGNGMPVHADCLPGGEAEVVEAETVDQDELDGTTSMDDLPERSVGDDPLEWVPGEFIDRIDGTPAINRKGFEVLAHFYEIDVFSDLEVAPEETDHTYCRVKARAVTADGRECEAYGSAHVDRGDRGDDPTLLLEMADTRARKRALSIATGVGAVAVEELKNEAGGGA